MPFDVRHIRWGYRLLTVSLIFAALAVTGCATRQDVTRVEEKVNQVRNDQLLLKRQLDHIDSLIVDNSDENNRMRVEVSSSLSDINATISQLQNQINDLQQIVYQLKQQGGSTGQQPLVIKTPGDTSAKGDTLVPANPSVDCRRLWDNAFKDMRRGQYDLAISGFSEYLDLCPNDGMADNSQYWIAEAYYEMKQYDRAIEEYQKLIKNYPESEKKVTAYFKIGRSYEEMGDKKKALENYLILQDQYPGSLEYEQVKDKIPELKG